jgi:hypothetical protein
MKEHAMSDSEFPVNDNTPVRRRGRPELPAEERVINLGICGTEKDIEHLRLYRPRTKVWNKKKKVWEEKDDFSGAFHDILDAVRIYRPNGPHSGPSQGVSTHAAKLKPGTRTTLKKELSAAQKRIAELEARLAAAGISPETEPGNLG